MGWEAFSKLFHYPKARAEFWGRYSEVNCLASAGRIVENRKESPEMPSGSIPKITVEGVGAYV